MQKKCCVVIPTYQCNLADEEMLSLKRISEQFPKQDIFLVTNSQVSLENYKEFIGNTVLFAEKYFASEKTYSKLLLKKEFYDKFSAYDYMLICQTDALLLKSAEELDKYMEQGYSYYGAPWFKARVAYQVAFKGISLVKGFLKAKKCTVGNGGFSLRKIDKTLQLLEEKKRYTRIWNAGEDIFFAYHGQQNNCRYTVAPIEIAQEFALEEGAKKQMSKGRIPLGIHAWKKMYPELLDDIRKGKYDGISI